MIKTLSKAQKMEREKFRIPRSVQDAIPIRRIFADGIFQVGNQYSKTWSFTDINYAIASKEDKTSMFLDYSELLNALDSGASAKITIYNRRINKAEFERSVLLPDRGDGLDEYRHEFNQMLTAQVTGTSNSIVRERYLTVSVVKRNADEARSYFSRVGTDLVTHLAQLSSVAQELTLTERLHIFRDFFKAGEQAAAGFNIVSLSLTVVDAVLLASVRENPVKFTSKMRPADILRPVRDPAYRPLLFYCIIGGLTGGFASPFLSVYELRVLGLSHTFITSVGVVSAVVGMAGSWVWGRLADRTAWNCVIWLTAFLNLSCTLGWSFVRPSFAHLVAPVLIVVAAGCAGGASLASTNLQFALSPESGKTAYFGVTAAMSSIATCTSAAVGTAIQPMLEKSMGDSSISLLFFVAGIGGFANLIINGRKLPSVT